VKRLISVTTWARLSIPNSGSQIEARWLNPGLDVLEIFNQTDGRTLTPL
jgi:hypothetical protein